MKKVILILILIPFLSGSQNAFAQTQERWKEIGRLSKKEQPVAFSDTTWLISGNLADEMYMRRGSFMYKGAFRRSMFVLADRSYLVVKREREEIQIKDEEGMVRIYRPDKKDTTYSDVAVKIAEQQLPAKPVSSVNTAEVKGSWEAYKRSRKPGAAIQKINYDKLIKSVLLLERADANGNHGFLYNTSGTKNASDKSYILVITAINGPEIIVKDKEGNESKITVWKADAGELILEDSDGMLYYCKKF